MGRRPSALTERALCAKAAGEVIDPQLVKPAMSANRMAASWLRPSKLGLARAASMSTIA
jgi:hypothetical protein